MQVVIQRQLNILPSSLREDSPGIYVEIIIQDEMEHIWRLTQAHAVYPAAVILQGFPLFPA
jgi:hypothetical protein